MNVRKYYVIRVNYILYIKDYNDDTLVNCGYQYNIFCYIVESNKNCKLTTKI